MKIYWLACIGVLAASKRQPVRAALDSLKISKKKQIDEISRSHATRPRSRGARPRMGQHAATSFFSIKKGGKEKWERVSRWDPAPLARCCCARRPVFFFRAARHRARCGSSSSRACYGKNECQRLALSSCSFFFYTSIGRAVEPLHKRKKRTEEAGRARPRRWRRSTWSKQRHRS